MAYQVSVTAMNSNLSDNAIRMSNKFNDWQSAYTYYGELASHLNLENAEWTGASDMNLEAGGRGYEYRIELICE